MALQVATTGNIAHGDIAVLDGDGPFTYMFWFRRVGAGDMTNDTSNTLGKGASKFFYHSSNKTPNGIACFDGSGGENRCENAGLLTTSFRHVCGHNAGGGSIPQWVLDGVQQGVSGAAQTFTDVGSAQLIWLGSAGSAFEVAHFKFWSAVLTLAEIQQEMLSYRPLRTANLFLWAPYDDGTSARDYSGNGNHGTATTCTQVPGPAIGFGAPQLVL